MQNNWYQKQCIKQIYSFGRCFALWKHREDVKMWLEHQSNYFFVRTTFWRHLKSEMSSSDYCGKWMIDREAFIGSPQSINFWKRRLRVLVWITKRGTLSKRCRHKAEFNDHCFLKRDIYFASYFVLILEYSRMNATSVSKCEVSRCERKTCTRPRKANGKKFTQKAFDYKK